MRVAHYLLSSLFLAGLSCFTACNEENNTPVDENFVLQRIKVGPITLSAGENTDEVAVDQPLVVTFSEEIDPNSVDGNLSLKEENGDLIGIDYTLFDGNKAISAQPQTNLKKNTNYIAQLGAISSLDGNTFAGGVYTFTTESEEIVLSTLMIGDKDLLEGTNVQDVPLDFTIEATFSQALSGDLDYSEYISLEGISLAFQLSTDQKTLTIIPQENPDFLTRYIFTISEDLHGAAQEKFGGFENHFYTVIDQSYKFPEISDEALLNLIQQQTFKYFWDFAHPVSGLALERNSSENTVTTGGSGFGIMTILVGIERGFISREEGIQRLTKIVDFLAAADRFHGVWPHWMNGNTGQTIPFSVDDNGGDLVETAFMIQGLLTVREFMNKGNASEKALMDKITVLWNEVEWDFYTQGENSLTWHWSPSVGFKKNLKIKGWNEGLIVYVLAASSPTHSIDAAVYHEGWANNGTIKNGSSFFGYELPLGQDRGGPLFFAHYSFLGLDPRNLEDQYANYWKQNVNHSKINRAYCILNPQHYVGYGENIWGLTASDDSEGYSAHSPTNDKGVITPTAALSSMPYTPVESLSVLKEFYYILGDKLWGSYGFYDAFNLTNGWIADSYLAIDQGPIIVMIENYRSALLWDLFMQNQEIRDGLDKLGFTSY